MELRIALRSLYRNKSYSIAAVSLLALGIGVNLAFFAILNANASRRPPHVFQPEELLEVNFDRTSYSGTRFRQNRSSYPMYEHVRSLLQDTAEVACEYTALVGFGKGAESREVQATLVSDNYFQVLGLQPKRGRLFSAEEFKASSSNGGVTLLDHSFWGQALSGATDLMELEVQIADQPFSVVGVLPDGFRGVAGRRSEVWLPLELSIGTVYPFERSPWEVLSNPEERLFRILVRPRENQTPQHIKALLLAALVGTDTSSLIGGEVLDVHLDPNRSNRLTRFSSRMLTWGSAMALLTLIVACANTATLGLHKGLSSSQKTLVRVQLGAPPGRLFFQAIVESATLSLVASLLAMALFVGIVEALETTMQLPAVPLFDLLGAKTLMSLFALILLVTSATGIVMGLQATRVGRRASSWGRLSVLRKPDQVKTLLVLTQVAAATCLLAQAGLFYTSIAEARNHLGFTPRNLIMLEMPSLRKSGHSEASIQAVFDELERHARDLPGTREVGRATAGPFRKFHITGVRGPDRQLPEPREGVYLTRISPGFIPSMGMKLSRGREFKPEDRWSQARVAILNERLAQRIWGNKDPVGDCVYVSSDTECTEVVGVVENSRIETSVFAEPKLQCYLPLSESVENGAQRAGDYLFVRVEDGMASKTIHELKSGPGLPNVYATVVDSLVQGEIRSMTVGLVIMSLLGFAAIAVSAVGVFGQLSYWVHSRKRDIGVRSTLGAGPSRIVLTVMAQSAVPLGVGALFGLLGSIPLSTLARSYIFGLSAMNFGSMLVVAFIVMLVGAVACAKPCLRAVTLDPAESLRTE